MRAKQRRSFSICAFPRFHLFMQKEKNHRVIAWEFTGFSFFEYFSYCQWRSSMGQGSYRIQVKTIEFASRQRHKWLGYLVHCIGHRNGQLSSYINYQGNTFVFTCELRNIFFWFKFLLVTCLSSSEKTSEVTRQIQLLKAETEIDNLWGKGKKWKMNLNMKLI